MVFSVKKGKDPTVRLEMLMAAVTCLVLASGASAEVRHTAKVTGPGGLLRFGDDEAAAEVSCDTSDAVTLTAVPQDGYSFYRWIGDTDGMDEATVRGATLALDADRAKSYRAVFLRNTGTGTASFIAEPAADASWFDAANWVGGELPVAGDAVTVAPNEGRGEKKKYTLVLDAPTPRYASVELKHGDGTGGCVLTMTNWTTRLEADTVTLGGSAVITCAGPFGENEMSNRIWIVCNDFTMKKAQRIKINNTTWSNFGYLSADDKGYKVSNGPGCVKYGAAHGGCGGFLTDQNAGVLAALPYGDEAWPQTPGSGGTLDKMVGGGVIRLDVTGTITIEATSTSDCINTISASATQSNFTEDKGMGAGGSISISCGRLISKKAVITATGGDGRTSWDLPERAFSLSLPGGGGRIAIHYDPTKQQVGDVINTTLSAAGGRLNCQWHAGKSEPAHWRSPTIADRYMQDADLGTVWLTDETLLKDVLGKGLSGSVVHPAEPTLDGIAFNSGFVRFPLDGGTMTVNGNLSVSGACSRLEFGGSLATNWIVTGTFLRTREPWALNVSGDVTLGEGARLDVRPAMTNGTVGAGAVVTVGGTLSLGGYANEFATVGGSYYRVTNTSVVVWNDGYTGVAPRFEVGSMVVASNAFVTSYRRGYLGGGSLQEAGFLDFPAYGFGPAISNVVVGSKTYTLYGGGDSNDSGAYYGGGGHGGRGGFMTNKSAYHGQTYDDVLRPMLAGSGGGGRYVQRSTLPGGGAIRVVAQESILVDGIICADGASTVMSASKKLDYGNGGAGAGGSILLECQQFSGGGILSACGGRNPNSTADNTKMFGCGGGGRIAVWTGKPYELGQRTRRCTVSTTPSALSDKGILFSGTATAVGGVSNRSDVPALTGDGGTVRFVYNPGPQGALLLVR